MIIRPAGLLVRQGQILMMSYRYGTVTRYTLPGGRLEIGESLTSCLQREFQEELGLTVVVGELLWLAQTSANDREVLHPLFHVEDPCPDRPLQPTLNPESTRADGLAWLSAQQVASASLYPAVYDQLQQHLSLDGPCSPVYLGYIRQDWL
ncbi:MAG: NUDIX domain-containing protein [Magnetococcales bacterium]|nr:NUDIX domain-containing protein [Magnetococcales bacterium]